MKLFYTVFGATIIVLCVVTLHIRSESDSFFGIADTKEIIVSSENAVEVKKIHVFPGQNINKGDTIVELDDPELTLKINYTAHQLDELTKQNTAHTKLSRSEMLQFKAEKNARINGLKAQIQELEMQYENNQALLSNLRSIDSKENIKGGMENSPIAIKIKQLKAELNLALDSSRYRESKLQNSLLYSGDPLAEKVKGFQSELALLKDERAKLLKIASIDGIIGTVRFKDGERVSPFDTIATIHNESPSFVNGYIPENVYTSIKIGMPLTITSVTKKNCTVSGKVIGVGSRIVEYPIRLRRHVDVQMWGREVIVKIPENNSFILGEKVRIEIKPTLKKTFFSSLINFIIPAAQAAQLSSDNVGLHTSMKNIRPDSSLILNENIEASGIHYLKGTGKCLVISDDTPQKKTQLYQIDTSGIIEKVIAIRGCSKINDLESITADELGRIYLLSSLNRNKNGKLPITRKLLLRVVKKEETYILDKSVDLLEALIKSIYDYSETECAKYLHSAIQSGTLDIEGAFVKSGSLYLGCKAPLINKKAVLLKVGLIDSVLNGKAIVKEQLAIEKTFDLTDPVSKNACGISDLCPFDNGLYILSTGPIPEKEGKETVGNLWKYQNDGKLVHCTNFKNSKPEGIAILDETGKIIITFDEGSKQPSKLLITSVSNEK